MESLGRVAPVQEQHANLDAQRRVAWHAQRLPLERGQVGGFDFNLADALGALSRLGRFSLVFEAEPENRLGVTIRRSARHGSPEPRLSAGRLALANGQPASLDEGADIVRLLGQ